MRKKSLLEDQAGKRGDGKSSNRAAEDRTGGRPAPAGRSEVAAGAPPSNTAPDNCNADPPHFLRWGVDSLYLSFKGELSGEVDKRLRDLKSVAQAKHPHDQVCAQYELGGHLFEVRDKGVGLFPYVLVDGAFRIHLARTGRRLPMAFVQVSSAYLAHHEPAQAEIELLALLRELGDLESHAEVSRIDLFVAFVSEADLEAFGRHAWVTRAKAISAYSVGGVFSGWMIGAGGPLSCRLYNKTLELQSSRKVYLLDFWADRGWVEGQTVWRLEFQIKRAVLKQYGVVSLYSVLGALDGLWSYASTEWLRLTIPSESDETRSRWPTQPLWGALAAVNWNTPNKVLGSRFNASRAPDERTIARIGLGAFTSYAALKTIFDAAKAWQGFQELVEAQCGRDAERDGVSPDDYLEERIRIKGRKFNTILNEPEVSEEDRKRLEVEAYAREYRKRSRG